jgi:hypothetical protein
MNSKKLLSTVLLYAAMLYVGFSFRPWTDFLHPSSGVVVANVIASLALSLGIVGDRELDRGGHSRILIPWVILASIITFPMVLWGRFSEVWFCASFALFAVPFPVALYFNRKRNKSTPQPTIANAR